MAASGPEERFITWDAAIYRVESHDGVLVSTATETSGHQCPPPPCPTQSTDWRPPLETAALCTVARYRARVKGHATLSLVRTPSASCPS